MAVEQYGAVEKDIVLSEIYQLAREVGFPRMILKPYVLPEMVELDYEEFDRFRAGKKVSGAFLSCPRNRGLRQRPATLLHREEWDEGVDECKRPCGNAAGKDSDQRVPKPHPAGADDEGCSRL